MEKKSVFQKSCLKNGILCTLGAFALAAGAVGCMAGGVVFSWRSSVNEAKAFDNYRLEELQKVQQSFDNGEISQSEFDVRVSFINGTEDVSVFRNIWIDEGHADCCEALYKTGIKQGAAGISMILTGIVAAGGAHIVGKIAYEEFKER